MAYAKLSGRMLLAKQAAQGPAACVRYEFLSLFFMCLKISNHNLW